MLTKPLSDMNEVELQEVADSLLQSTYANISDPARIWDVIQFCKLQGLDPFQRPVHVVRFGKAGQAKEEIYPGVQALLIKASRSNCAGIGAPKFFMAEDAKPGDPPEYCKVTVKRLLSNGYVAKFSHIEYFKEAFKDSRIWNARKRGQLAKCALAGALRKGFPEVAGMYTFEEMEAVHDYHGDDGIEGVNQVSKAPAQSKAPKRLGDGKKEKAKPEAPQKTNEPERSAEQPTEDVPFADESILATIQNLATKAGINVPGILEEYDLVAADSFLEARIPVTTARKIYADIKKRGQQ